MQEITRELLQNQNVFVNLHRVFHGIRLLRLMKIGCRETINFFYVFFRTSFPFEKLFLYLTDIELNRQANLYHLFPLSFSSHLTISKILFFILVYLSFSVSL